MIVQVLRIVLIPLESIKSYPDTRHCTVYISPHISNSPEITRPGGDGGGPLRLQYLTNQRDYHIHFYKYNWWTLTLLLHH